MSASSGDTASSKRSNDEGSHTNARSISSTASDAPKGIRQQRITSSASRDITSPGKKSTSAGSGDPWTCGVCQENISIGLQCYRCGQTREDYFKSSHITSPGKKSTSAGSGKIWICGHCDVGYMSMVLETHCNRCGRKRDVYSFIGYPESPARR